MRSRNHIEHIIVTDEDISYHKYKKRLNNNNRAKSTEEEEEEEEVSDSNPSESVQSEFSGVIDPADRNHHPTHVPRSEVEEHTKLTAAAAHVPNYWVPDGEAKFDKNRGK